MPRVQGKPRTQGNHESHPSSGTPGMHPPVARRAALGARPARLYPEHHARRRLEPCAVARSRVVRLTLAIMTTPLSREHLTELHCIQPLTNVPSILALGILSHEAATQVQHSSVAME